MLNCQSLVFNQLFSGDLAHQSCTQSYFSLSSCFSSASLLWDQGRLVSPSQISFMWIYYYCNKLAVRVRADEKSGNENIGKVSVCSSTTVYVQSGHESGSNKQWAEMARTGARNVWMEKQTIVLPSETAAIYRIWKRVECGKEARPVCWDTLRIGRALRNNLESQQCCVTIPFPV